MADRGCRTCKWRKGIFCEYKGGVIDLFGGSDCEAWHPKGCFITTAVCSALGRSDDCEELTMFRKFRDTFMLETAEMRGEVDEYYEIAPRICEAIDETGPETAIKTYSKIWSSSLKPAFEALLTGENRKAHGIYKQMVMGLKKEYIDTQRDKEIRREI
jgi:hypothetical protein